MSFTPSSSFQVGHVTVSTTNNGGHPPEYFAEKIVERLMFVADTAPEPIKAQALAFQGQMKMVVLEGIKLAIATDRAYRK